MVRRRRGAWANRGSGARGGRPRGPAARGTGGRTRRPTTPDGPARSRRSWRARGAAGARRPARRRPSPAFGFFLDHGQGHADQTVQLIGARPGEQPFRPGALPLTEPLHQPAQEREQRHSLQLHAAVLLPRLLLAQGQPPVAVRVAPRLGGEGGHDLHELHVVGRERPAVAGGAEEDRPDGYGGPIYRFHGGGLLTGFVQGSAVVG